MKYYQIISAFVGRKHLSSLATDQWRDASQTWPSCGTTSFASILPNMTSSPWLDCQRLLEGYYFDGHELTVEVHDATASISTRICHTMPSQSEDFYASQPPCDRPLVVLVHDETASSYNDNERRGWSEEGCNSRLKSKNPGTGIIKFQEAQGCRPGCFECCLQNGVHPASLTPCCTLYCVRHGIRSEWPDV